MESVIIDEPVDVGAIFSRNAVKPKWFIWNTRKYPVQEITYTWQDKRGEARILHFAVTDGATLFELSLNLVTLRWRLEKTTVV